MSNSSKDQLLSLSFTMDQSFVVSKFTKADKDKQVANVTVQDQMVLVSNDLYAEIREVAFKSGWSITILHIQIIKQGLVF